MAFELRFPNETSPTTSWLPVENPTPLFMQDEGVPAIIHTMPDGKTRYVYVTGSIGDDFSYQFDGISDAELASLRAFLAVVLGAAFRVKEPVSGSFFTVQFKNLNIQNKPFGPSTWTVVLPLVRSQ